MHTVDDRMETIHLYVLREEEKEPFVVLPMLAALLFIGAIIGLTYYSALHPVYTHKTLMVLAVALPPQVFRATTNVIPNGVHTYPATYAHGVLTFTNGSIIGQSVPAGFTIDGVATDQAVYVPAGSADGFGRATVSAHALTSGKSGNVAALAINAVIGSSLYIRNLTTLRGGKDRYSVKFITSKDRALALSKSRNLLAASVIGLHHPCTERVSGAVTVIWRCIFVKYSVPTSMHVTGARLSGGNVVVSVMCIEYPMPMRWVK
jgi:hypothetical protein